MKLIWAKLIEIEITFFQNFSDNFNFTEDSLSNHCAVVENTCKSLRGGKEHL
jgi:hypothetical protein